MTEAGWRRCYTADVRPEPATDHALVELEILDTSATDSQTLGDPTRRAIFERLFGKPRSVREPAAALPVSRPAVSQHLKLLKESGLATDRAPGTHRVYRVDPAGVAAKCPAPADVDYDAVYITTELSLISEEEDPAHMASRPRGFACSFCGKAQPQVQRLIAGPGAVFICDECVRLCNQIIAEGPPPVQPTAGVAPATVRPRRAVWWWERLFPHRQQLSSTN